MSIYNDLGTRPIINADATLTRLGGSLMPPEVLAAMTEAAGNWVDLPEFQRRIGERIAALTKNEACFVCGGAAAGLTLATAAAVAGNDRAAIQQLPHMHGLKNEVIVHRNQRIGYDYAVRQVGVTLVEIGNATHTVPWELEHAINDRTAAIVWFEGWMVRDGDLPLPQVIEIANRRGIPVIVDAAAQLPPVENLWKFTHMGATVAVFSGGKDLRGPQSTGLMLGKKSFIDLMPLLASPNPHIGRPMKVSKEDMAGAYAAVQRYMKLDHASRADYCEETVADWVGVLSRLPGVQAERGWPNEAGQPLPRAHLILDSGRYRRDDVVAAMLQGDPPVAISAGPKNDVFLNPMTLEPGQEKIVLQRIVGVLRGRTE